MGHLFLPCDTLIFRADRFAENLCPEKNPGVSTKKTDSTEKPHGAPKILPV
jgi:hypothetical protein